MANDTRWWERAPEPDVCAEPGVVALFGGSSTGSRDLLAPGTMEFPGDLWGAQMENASGADCQGWKRRGLFGMQITCRGKGAL